MTARMQEVGALFLAERVQMQLHSCTWSAVACGGGEVSGEVGGQVWAWGRAGTISMLACGWAVMCGCGRRHNFDGVVSGPAVRIAVGLVSQPPAGQRTPHREAKRRVERQVVDLDAAAAQPTLRTAHARPQGLTTNFEVIRAVALVISPCLLR